MTMQDLPCFSAALSNAIGQRALVQRTLGRSGDSVYAVGNDLYLKISPRLTLLQKERDACLWFEKKLPAHIQTPRVIHFEELPHADGQAYAYLLTTAVDGTPACHPHNMEDPAALCRLLAEGLQVIHSLSREGFPSHLISPYPSLPQAAATRAPVVTHGDFCLPNVLIKDGKLSGFVDIGQAFVGDPWADIAWCLWSLAYNLNTTEYHPLLLSQLGVALDKEAYDIYTAM